VRVHPSVSPNYLVLAANADYRMLVPCSWKTTHLEETAQTVQTVQTAQTVQTVQVVHKAAAGSHKFGGKLLDNGMTVRDYFGMHA
jgi:hypothetical protein